MIRRINHVQITIAQGAEDEARRFYCDVLGLMEIEKPEPLRARGGFWLAVGEQQIHVGVEEGFDRASTKAHVAYEVDEIEACREKLQAYGVEVIESIAIEGYDRFELRDPFGNRIEIMRPR
jgi:catechol 2,3-dioxygenase-like lactoylglutathione lyase family enzyme